MCAVAATKRYAPIAECHRDAQVASWFVEDKLTRQAARGCLRGLLSQLEVLGVEQPATVGTDVYWYYVAAENRIYFNKVPNGGSLVEIAYYYQ